MDERWSSVLLNKELAEMIVSLSPERVRGILLCKGYDFSEDEIIETAKELKEIMLLCSTDDYTDELYI